MRYEITLNGRVYDVEVEQHQAQVTGQRPIRDTAPPPRPQVGTPGAPVASSSPSLATRRAEPPHGRPGLSAEPVPVGEPIPAPMPGVIKKVLVQVGTQVAANQVLVTLEAMKMENEIVSPRPALVTEVMVAPGQAVAAGLPLVRLNFT